MKIQQQHFAHGNWKPDFMTGGFDITKANLVLVFGAPDLVSNPEIFEKLRLQYCNAAIISSSTAGEIQNNEVHDNTVAVTAIQFEKTKIRCSVTSTQHHQNSHDTGKHLMAQLLADDLCAVFIISDGTFVNGSELVSGFNENNPNGVPVTGGLAGDGARFAKTYVGLNELPKQGIIVAVGFYGTQLEVGHGSFGGWDEFGPERTITRSDKNILFEIDGKNALDLYKEYLGPYSDELPGSALLFPLSMKQTGSNQSLVRTILNVSDEDKTMTFAGNLPNGSKVRLMKANFDNLIFGSSTAARNSFLTKDGGQPELAILVSCVGRKLILQERTDEEVQAARDIFGSHTSITGFYSYGELSPLNPSAQCELHNQTMTITTFSEL